MTLSMAAAEVATQNSLPRALCTHRALTLTGRVKDCLNLGSYNYLGFAAADEYCTPRVLDTMSSLGWAMCSSRVDAGEAAPHVARKGHIGVLS